MDEIEEKLKALEEANAKLLLENESLRALNERLMSEKCQPLTVQTTSPYQAPPPSLSPPPSEYSDRASSPGSASSISSSDCSLVDSRSFESAELINASQQKSQDRGWAGLWTAMALMTAVVPAAFCQAAAASCQLPPAAPKLSPSSSPPAATSQPPPTTTAPTCLPIKKRHLLPPWWPTSILTKNASLNCSLTWLWPRLGLSFKSGYCGYVWIKLTYVSSTYLYVYMYSIQFRKYNFVCVNFIVRFLNQ